MNRLRDAWAVLTGRKYATTYKITVRGGALVIETGQPLSPAQADQIRAAFEASTIAPPSPNVNPNAFVDVENGGRGYDHLPPPPTSYRRDQYHWRWTD